MFNGKMKGCAMAQMVRLWPLRSEDHVQTQASPCEIWWTKWHWERSFLVLQFCSVMMYTNSISAPYTFFHIALMLCDISIIK